MSFSNHMSADQLAAIEPGDNVFFESSGASSWSGWDIITGKVVRLTPTQIVVHYNGARGTIETRFRRGDGRKVGPGRGELLDPNHPTTQREIAARHREQRRRAIDALANRWTRERENLELLRRLQVAVSEYLDAEDES